MDEKLTETPTTPHSHVKNSWCKFKNNPRGEERAKIRALLAKESVRPFISRSFLSSQARHTKQKRDYS